MADRGALHPGVACVQAPRWAWHMCGGMFDREDRPSGAGGCLSASRCKAACLRRSISSRCSVVSMLLGGAGHRLKIVAASEWHEKEDNVEAR